MARIPRSRRGAWRGQVANQVQRLRDELAALNLPQHEGELFAARKRMVEQHLERAEEAIGPVGALSLVPDWYSGTAIETAWASLHRASETLLLIQRPPSLISELPDIEAGFETSIGPEDPRRPQLRKALDEAREILFAQQPPHEVPEPLRARLVAARRAANAASDTAHGAVRKWRNALALAGFGVAVLAVAVAVVNAFVPEFLSLAASDGAGGGDAAQPWEVELVGAVGGAVAAVIALNRFSGFTDPYGLPTTQALLRIPMAALSALFGVVLMQTSALEVLEPQTGTAILAFAFVFGYAQEPLLRMIDRQAGTVLNPARDKNEPAARRNQTSQGTQAA